LLELEYLHVASQSMRTGYRYQIAWWDDAEAMRERVRKHLLDQLTDL
jgi:hypothetical protein